MYLVLIGKSVSEKILLEDILYLMQDMRDVQINTDKRVRLVKGKVDDFQEKLNEHFYRCHSYCIVNLDRVSKMSDCIISFDCGKEIYLSKNNFFKAKKAYEEYLTNTY